MEKRFALINVVIPHQEIMDTIEHDAYGTVVQNLIWIAVQSKSTDLGLMLEDIDEEIGLRTIFPEMSQEHIDEYFNKGAYIDLLVLYKKLGFIAQIEVPEHAKFIFDEDGKVKGYTTLYTVRNKCYVYGENGPALFQRIIDTAATFFNKSVLKEQTKKA